MKTALEVSPEKLRGGFYTPPALVDFCLARLATLVRPETFRVLEPSAGDGPFLRGLVNRWPGMATIQSITAVELLEREAAKCRQLLDPERDRILSGSVLPWALATDELFDAAVGNPPFVRFQFVSSEDRAAATVLSHRIGVSIKGVANLWIPVLLASMSRLRRGGAFTFVVPAECFTGAAAGRVREFLLREVSDLRLDLFPSGSFPGVLQEVGVLSGTRTSPKAASLTICQHRSGQPPATWTLTVSADRQSWTRYLLEADHRAALSQVASKPFIHRLRELAIFEVSIVTGANDFFAIDDATVTHWELAAWREPLLARIRHAPGLKFGAADHARACAEGLPAWLLNFRSDRPDPARSTAPATYLSLGERRGLHTRFKCRIREPWYRVPNFQRGDLLLSKRSHSYPRVVVNEAGAYTTDTIYRGRMVAGAMTPHALSAVFHNSLTALTAEMEGRSFGGGVLELVPSEVGRLLVPRLDGASSWLEKLDRIARTGTAEELIQATDAALVRAGLLSRDEIQALASARSLLLDRRHERNRQSRSTSPQLELAA